MITVKLFEQDKAMEWNEFLPRCKNQTFLFSRNFMEYHKDRFRDYSLMVFENEKLVAIVPADIDEEHNCISSHSGLTYGGIVVEKNSRTTKNLEYFYHILRFLYDQNILKFKIKQIPAFYNSIPADEFDYAFFLTGAVNYRTDITSTITLKNRIAYQERRLRNIKKAGKLPISIAEDIDFTNFWKNILEPNLLERFDISPVHTLDEITSLANNNKPHIRQFNACINGEIFAGCTIFETETTAHAQYISASKEGQKNGALDLLFHELIDGFFAHKDYFDFGIVNENNGLFINHGLLDWKEGFGARSFAHRFFEMDTKNYYKLEKILQSHP